MPKKGGTRRKFSRYIRGNLDENLQLVTLAAKTLVSDVTDEQVDGKTRVSSIDATYSLDGVTAPQGPFLFGVAMSDYTDAEIEAVIENTGSWNEGDLINQEIAKRKVRIIGTLQLDSGAAGTTDYKFNNGKMIKTKLNWMLTAGDRLRFWVYNLAGSAVSTTDPAFRVNGSVNLWTL